MSVRLRPAAGCMPVSSHVNPASSTLVELAGLTWEETGMQPGAGRSLTDILRSPRSRVASERDHVLVGKERHDVGRPHDWGYPIRGIIKEETLYLRNYEPDR